jgi:hypothetical protein
VTFTPAAWAIDGARSPGSLARLALRASVKESGVINPGDMKVVQLASPGNGVRILAGGAAIDNRYVANSGQEYVVENVDELIVNSGNAVNWPATNPGVARSHLLCASIGDPLYSTAGHPWLTDANKPATPAAALDFQYVRPMVIPNVPAGTRYVEDLTSPPAYPVYALARLDLPSNWTSIADAQIVDLRQVVNPRSKIVQYNIPVSDGDLLSVGTNYLYETWPDAADFSTYVPKWATKVYTTGFIQSFIQGTDTVEIDAAMRIAMRKADNTFVAAAQQSLYYSIPPFLQYGYDKHVSLAGPISIPAAQRGTTCRFTTEATVANKTTMNGKLTTSTRTTVAITLRFVEEAV